jgi:phospholipid/cholesterol/gamma-HCH transport system permease protein
MPNDAQQRWIEIGTESDATVLHLLGAWRLANLPAVAAQIRELKVAPQGRCILDGRRLEALDTGTAFVLLRSLSAAGLTPQRVSVREVQAHHESLLRLVQERMALPSVAASSQHLGLMQRLGVATVKLARELQAHLRFGGEVTLEGLALARRPALFRWRAAIAQFELVAIDAVPIIVLMSLLIGVVFAHLLGAQARRYGATIFVVDGIGLAICRELAPLLVAVLVAGRSGAAFTAQIGAMKVQEEVDAIRTLGLSPIQVLVVPRLAAIVVGLPLLVFLADVAGIVGGMLISAGLLDIPPRTFIHRLHAVLPVSAVVIGLVKAPVFAIFIALIACRQGLSVTRDARSVGQHTTATVVQAMVWVITIDAAFAVVLQALNI